MIGCWSKNTSKDLAILKCKFLVTLMATTFTYTSVIAQSKEGIRRLLRRLPLVSHLNYELRWVRLLLLLLKLSGM